MNTESTTLCVIYKSLKKPDAYIYTQEKDDFSHIPEELLKTLGQLEFVMELGLTPERKLAREDVNKVIHNLSVQGFHLQLPPPKPELM
ncbi:hypothetical protein BOW53_09405 [Solemya pervernicosa gill symbiont]|uniref:YcgL domain-containing protein BOW53_09405 n=2 Tax=Gammaproteobacteria incertae sedis TaxID=118884 RepID=A0A1T2L4I6_9GAMM|nr:YcgL domain-containing protein [Candidatus Reidiella endopervernicosa]OOZ39981.1 hypothetical protein BOW53_09405 [Solemya pervernicosa gill symbiont]QKQ27782.1 YcgL domain-containing protein [Candidatus Reidiella endopervernicosa]